MLHKMKLLQLEITKFEREDLISSRNFRVVLRSADFAHMSTSGS